MESFIALSGSFVGGLLPALRRILSPSDDIRTRWTAFDLTQKPPRGSRNTMRSRSGPQTMQSQDSPREPHPEHARFPHALPALEVLEALASSRGGLTTEEARARRGR
jgi:hypothetical protein